MENEKIISKKELIAPCGMYCGLCDKYLAYSHQLPKKRGKVSHCKGCRPLNKNCSFVKKKCVNGKIYEIDYCYECDLFPCAILKKGSTKYNDRYSYSLVESLNMIKKNGADWFINKIEKQFNCERCGDTICVHNHKCYSCDRDELIG